MTAVSRRELWQLGVPIGAVALLGLSGRSVAAVPPAVYAEFPSQDPARVHDTVLYAHSDVDRVRTLVTGSPALANAAIDWGLGDWESALGAASHMGRRDIAQVLLDHGARPDLFTFAMLGNLSAVRAIVEASPGIQGIDGPHGISLLSHAEAGGDASKPVVDYLTKLGGADPKPAGEPLALELAAYLGTFAYGAGADERFEIIEQRGNLGLKRGDGFPRRLFHLGGNEFHPGGARAVRIRFEIVDGRATAVRVLDPEVIVVGTRVP